MQRQSVRPHTSQLAETDRDAIAEYIKSLPPRAGRKALQ
jgi:hypothetical protein